jgi:hypothetical protein
MKLKQVYAIAFFLIIAGCGKIDTGEQIVFGVDEKTRVDLSLSFSIDSVSDYRCPSDVICIWGGDVDVFLNFTRPFSKLDAMLRLNDPDHNLVKINGYTFKLLGVDPYPVSTTVTLQKDFRIRMIIL